MKRAFNLPVLQAVCIAICCGEASAQLPADVLTKYRFIPSRSTLDVTGGPFGRLQFFVYDKFEVQTGYELTPPHITPPVLSTRANFHSVQSTLRPDSTLPFRWDTEFTLRLSGLTGNFTPGDPTRIIFLGTDGQGATLRLTATQQGRLLRLVGENEPLCCNQLKYKIDALAYAMPYADFNLDGMIDSRDAQVLGANIGTFADANFEQGDADGDGDVDGVDFLVWQREIGAATPLSAFATASSTDLGLSAAVVPEPVSIVLLLLAAPSLHRLLRQKRRTHAARRIATPAALT